MSKTTDDLIDRIQGEAFALRGVKVQLSPEPSAAAVEVVVPAKPAPEVTQEIYDHAKKVVAEMKGNVEALEAELAKESKVPEPAGAGSAHKSAGKG